MHRKLLQILRSDSSSPEKIEVLLQKLASEEPGLFVYLGRKLELQKTRIAAECRADWFNYLSWWFARLLMYGSFLIGGALAYVYGKAAVDPISWGLAGAAVYYVILQIFTPARLRRDAEIMMDNHAEKESLATSLPQDDMAKE